MENWTMIGAFNNVRKYDIKNLFQILKKDISSAMRMIINENNRNIKIC